MHATADRLDFAPPPQRGLPRAVTLAVVAHLLLVLALMNGLQWKRTAENVAAEAELWSTVPQAAAPRAVPVPPTPTPVVPPPPVVQAPPLVPEPPVVKAPPRPEPPAPREADIAADREKQRREVAQRKQAELERERDKRREAEQRNQAELERERDKRKKLEAQQKKEDALERKQEQAKLAAAEQRKAEQRKASDDERKRKQQEAEAKQVAQQREDNMRRMQAMAGSGALTATGNAAQSSGPSAGWAGRVQARVRPNIVFSDDAPGNPKAEVEVRLAPDGTIVGKRLVKGSGVKGWDDAVLRALDKTETLPRDVDGRVPASVVIEFRPRG